MSKQHGFTITEVIVAIALASISSLLMVSAYLYSYGGVLVRQAEAEMVQQSRLLIRNISDDMREGSEIRTSSTITDSYNAGGWSTSDPANVLIITVPALDADNDLIFDPATGYPFYHEAVYFLSNIDQIMYRRLLANPLATGSTQISTCPAGQTGCVPDRVLVENAENMSFELYDIDNIPTAIREDARSASITIDLSRRFFGRDLTTTNATRITLRNED